MRVLLADDDRVMAEALRQGLEEEGHVILGFNGNRAATFMIAVLLLRDLSSGLNLIFERGRFLRNVRLSDAAEKSADDISE